MGYVKAASACLQQPCYARLQAWPQYVTHGSQFLATGGVVAEWGSSRKPRMLSGRAEGIKRGAAGLGSVPRVNTAAPSAQSFAGCCWAGD